MIHSKQWNLKKIKPEERSRYFTFLVLADENEVIVNTYINEGEMFSINVGEEAAGVVLFTFHSCKVVELKNIALAPKYRGEGLGKLVVTEACNMYKKEGLLKMIVGTANSSIANLAFYQKAGFRMVEIKRDYFKDYPSPVFEDGIRALDMVMFEKNLME